MTLKHTTETIETIVKEEMEVHTLHCDVCDKLLVKSVKKPNEMWDKVIWSTSYYSEIRCDVEAFKLADRKSFCSVECLQKYANRSMEERAEETLKRLTP